jgi:hypothetical protein
MEFPKAKQEKVDDLVRKAAKEGASHVVPVIKCVGKRDGSKKHTNYVQYLLEGGALVLVDLDNMTAKYRGPDTDTAKHHAKKQAALEKKAAERAARKAAREPKKSAPKPVMKSISRKALAAIADKPATKPEWTEAQELTIKTYQGANGVKRGAAIRALRTAGQL